MLVSSLGGNLGSSLLPWKESLWSSLITWWKNLWSSHIPLEKSCYPVSSHGAGGGGHAIQSNLSGENLRSILLSCGKTCNPVSSLRKKNLRPSLLPWGKTRDPSLRNWVKTRDHVSHLRRRVWQRCTKSVLPARIIQLYRSANQI